MSERPLAARGDANTRAEDRARGRPFPFRPRHRRVRRPAERRHTETPTHDNQKEAG